DAASVRLDQALQPDDACRAARLLGAAAALRQATGIVVAPVLRPLIAAAQERARNTLSPMGFAAAWHTGTQAAVQPLVAEVEAEAASVATLLSTPPSLEPPQSLASLPAAALRPPAGFGASGASEPRSHPLRAPA